jgi:hypothetical protein
MTPTNRGEWTWFGVPGHFICSRWCRFHLTTCVGPWLVSTVGEYVHPRHSQGSEKTETEWLKSNWPGEDIGYQRKYETMVFLAGEPCASSTCGCGLPAINGHEFDSNGYNNRGDAQAGHLAMCAKWAEREENDHDQ